MAKRGTKKITETLDLAAIVNCGEPGYIFTFPDEHAELLAAGYIQVNPKLKDENGAIATFATQAGINFINSQKGGEQVSEANNNFVIEDGIDIPENQRGGSPAIYPFDKLEVGQSFFVPATDARPNPVKSLNSTVSTANNRYASPDPSGETRLVNRGLKKGTTVPKMIYSRKFIIKAGEKDGVKGARIWRKE